MTRLVTVQKFKNLFHAAKPNGPELWNEDIVGVPFQSCVHVAPCSRAREILWLRLGADLLARSVGCGRRCDLGKHLSPMWQLNPWLDKPGVLKVRY